MKSVDIQSLCSIIEVKLLSDDIKMLYKDAFATGCYLHGAGYKVAGKKLCSKVLEALGWNEQITYFSSIIDTLDGNEDTYATDVSANREFSSLSKVNGLLAKPTNQT
jgi:hypothetical protein